MAALRRKKAHETALVATQNSMATIENQIQSIEAANFNAEMMRTMKEASKAMEGIHKNMNIEQVEETMYIHRITVLRVYLTVAGTLFVNTTPWRMRSQLP